ncbi:MAG TPA: YitT family protein [Burkholderiaceae bacterium]|nr:YitT family protein [Burkholderiaceae bacterium]
MIDSSAPAANAAQTALRHSLFEDAQALLTGGLFIALGIAFFARAGLLAGGTAGLAFLLHYATGWSFGVVFFVVNLPFYWLAAKTMGRAFMAKTFVAVAATSLCVELMPRVLAFERLHPLFAALIGGFLIGAGLLMLFRHKASLGGINVLVLYLQDRHGWRAGKAQMAIDCAIVLAALTLVEPTRVALSVIGAVALNLVVAVNHRPGRYLGI